MSTSPVLRDAYFKAPWPILIQIHSFLTLGDSLSSFKTIVVRMHDISLLGLDNFSRSRDDEGLRMSFTVRIRQFSKN